jgi:hypothetical protein
MMHFNTDTIGSKKFVSRLEVYAPRCRGACYVSDVIPSTSFTPAQIKNCNDKISKSGKSDVTVLAELEQFLLELKPAKETKLVLIVVDPFAMAAFFDLVWELDKMVLFGKLFCYWLDLTSAAHSLITYHRTRMCKALSEDSSRLDQLMWRVLGRSVGKDDFLPQRMFDVLFVLSGRDLCSDHVRRLLLPVDIEGMPRVHVHVATAKYMRAPFKDEEAVVEIGVFIPRLKKTANLQIAPYGHVNCDAVAAAGFTSGSNGEWLYKRRMCVTLRDAISRVLSDMSATAKTAKAGGGVVLISMQSGEAIPQLLKVVMEMGLEADFFDVVKGYSDVFNEWKDYNGKDKSLKDLLATLPKCQTWPILLGEQAARGSKALGKDYFDVWSHSH